jgi:hypothetical protein
MAGGLMPITFGKGNGGSKLQAWTLKMKELKAKVRKVKEARRAGRADIEAEKALIVELDAFEQDIKGTAPERIIAELRDMHAFEEYRKAVKFPMGHLVVTRGVNDYGEKDSAFVKFVEESVKRHLSGDWGNMDAEDKKQNEWALKHGERLMSVYEQKPFPKIWIITESDRSVTTVLFPEEY